MGLRPGVDYVTIHHKGYERKLTDGEICNPFDDVVRNVPDSLKSFRLGYTIKTGRLFIIADDPQATAKRSHGPSPAERHAGTIPIPTAWPREPSAPCLRENIPSHRTRTKE